MLPAPAKLAFLFSFFLAAAPLGAEPPPGPLGGELKDVVYGRAGGHDLRLDFFRPTSESLRTAQIPVVLYLHGGGWRYGDKSEGERLAQICSQRGLAFASANYRLDGEALWPAQILDAKTAVRFLRANARRYGLDPARIGVCGASAGGHLAALLGTTAGVAALEDRSEGSPQASDRVQAVCDVSGPTDLGIKDTTFFGRFFVRHELGGSAQEKPDFARQADPSRYVHGGEPPFLLIYGDKDSLVVPEHAYRLENALRAHGDDVTLDLVPGGGHVPFGHEQQWEAVGFFVKVFHWNHP